MEPHTTRGSVGPSRPVDGRRPSPPAQALAYPAGLGAIDQVDRRTWDRRRTDRFVLRERRSGYERRRSARGSDADFAMRLRAWFDARPWSLPVILLAANLLSLVDIFLTLRILEAGGAEVNPLMRSLLEHDVRTAAVTKALMVAGATLLIWRYRRHRRILPLALLALAAFAMIVAYQAFLLLAG